MLCRPPIVALRKGGVDRNSYHTMDKLDILVALRKEGVDRNYFRCDMTRPMPVALRKGTWIEIKTCAAWRMSL